GSEFIFDSRKFFLVVLTAFRAICQMIFDSFSQRCLICASYGLISQVFHKLETLIAVQRN
ncbi:MAG: hypothetical protein WBG94_13575, partial [Anaerolineales bacterium]